MLMNENKTICRIPRNDMHWYLHCCKHFSVLMFRFTTELSGKAFHEVPALALSKQNLLLLMVFSAQISFLSANLETVPSLMVVIEMKPNHLVIPTLNSFLAPHCHHRMFVFSF